jgi:peptidoglycan-associated lipoprotein
MNLFSKKVSPVLLGAVLVFAGCTKKPQRPTPDQTMLGQGLGGGLNGDAAGNMGAEGLENRAAMQDGDRQALAGNTVYFDYDKSDVKASERPKLQATKEYLDKNPDATLRLEGHCDWRGTAEYNLALGERRAGATKSYLEKLGVPTAKLETVSKGDTEAKEKGSDAEMKEDRKVVLIVLKK